MTHTCSNCGFTARSTTFFRKEKGGLFGLHLTVCEACQPYKPTSYEQHVTMRMLISPISMLVPILLIGYHDLENALFLVTMVAASLPTLPLRIFLHEAGHAFMARALGKEVWDIRIGCGPILTRLKIAGVTFDIRRYCWISGRVHYFDPKGQYTKTGCAAITAAGPFANVLTAIIAFGLSYLFGIIGVLSAILAGFGLFNLLMAFYNLMPQRFGDDESVASDGQLLLDLLKPRSPANPLIAQMYRVAGYSQMQRYDEAVAVASDGWQTSPLKIHFAINIMHNLSRGRGDRAALNFYFSNQPEFQGTDNAKEDQGAGLHWIKANVAWSALKLADETLREVAARTAKAAFDVEPQMPGALGTYGAWLVSVDQADLGLPLLMQAARNIDNAIDKADFCRFLARGWQQVGNSEWAILYTALSQYTELKA